MIEKDLKSLVEHLSRTTESLGSETIEGAMIESCDKKILIPTDSPQIEEHLMKQGAIYAYFAEAYRMAKEILDVLIMQFEEQRLHERSVVAGDLELAKKKKPTIGDIDTGHSVRFEKEIKERFLKVQGAKEDCDKVKNWLDALRMKNSSLNSLAYMTGPEKSAEFTVYRKKVEELMAKAGLGAVDELIKKLEDK